MKLLGKTLSQAKLWSQLQLRADADLPCNDAETSIQNLTMLKLIIRQQHLANEHLPEGASQSSNHSCGDGNLKLPLGVPALLLCGVNISLTFSSLSTVVPPKKQGSNVGIFSGLSFHHSNSRGGMLGSTVSGGQLVDIEKRQMIVSESLSSESASNILENAIFVAPSKANYTISEQVFEDIMTSSFGDNSDDTGSLVFPSQGSSLLEPPEAHPGLGPMRSSPFHVTAMHGLIDAALRNLICTNPIRTAPGISLKTSTLEARLNDIAPSTFTPGYAEAIAARARLVPTVARFMTSFLQKARRPSVTRKKDELIQQFSFKQYANNLEERGQSQDERRKLKEVLKTHLWMTMANNLKDSELARRLKPLHIFAKTNTISLNGQRKSANTAEDHSTLSEVSDDGMLLEERGACFGSTIHKEVDDIDEMLDVDDGDGAEEYEDDLFEAHEEELTKNLEHYSACDFGTVCGNHDDYAKRKSAHNPTAPSLSSPMLEVQDCCSPLLIGTPSTQGLNHSSAVMPGDADASATTGINMDDSWTDLLGEASPSPFQGNIDSTSRHYPSPSVDHDYEPDFQQWEFDVEQEFDEMLF